MCMILIPLLMLLALSVHGLVYSVANALTGTHGPGWCSAPPPPVLRN
jgi:hypothetical protein